MDKTEKLIKDLRISLIFLAIFQIVILVVLLFTPNTNIITNVIQMAITVIFIVAIKGVGQYSNYGFIFSIMIGIIYLVTSIPLPMDILPITKESIIVNAPQILRIVFGLYIIILAIIILIKLNASASRKKGTAMEKKITNMDIFEEIMDDNNRGEKSAEQLEFEEYNKKDKVKHNN